MYLVLNRQLAMAAAAPTVAVAYSESFEVPDGEQAAELAVTVIRLDGSGHLDAGLEVSNDDENWSSLGVTSVPSDTTTLLDQSLVAGRRYRARYELGMISGSGRCILSATVNTARR